MTSFKAMCSISRKTTIDQPLRQALAITCHCRESFSNPCLILKPMIRRIFLSSWILVVCSCGNEQNSEKTNDEVRISDTSRYNGLKGTWIRQNKQGFTLIEIKDTDHVLYYQLIDRKADIDTITFDRYWYYNSKATFGYWDSSTIWIDTRKFRFDYKLKGDTLIEFDKMGDQGNFIKVYTDEEKQAND